MGSKRVRYDLVTEQPPPPPHNTHKHKLKQATARFHEVILLYHKLCTVIFYFVFIDLKFFSRIFKDYFKSLEFVTTLLVMCFLASGDAWNLSSLTRDQTCIHCTERPNINH